MRDSVPNARYSSVCNVLRLSMEHLARPESIDSMIINPRRACAQRGLLQLSRVCLCMCVYVSVRSFLPPRASI